MPLNLSVNSTFLNNPILGTNYKFTQPFLFFLNEIARALNTEDERVDDRVAALIQTTPSIIWTYDDVAGTLSGNVSLVPFTTSDLAEGSSLYFTNERVDDRVANLIQNGIAISWTYNDIANTFTANLQFNSVNLKITTDQINTIQDIDSTATPTFAGLTLNGLSGYFNTSFDIVVNTLTIGLGGGNISTNSALGVDTLNANTTGSANTAFGYNALFANTTGSNNVAFGFESLLTLTTGSGNTSIGYNCGNGVTTGSNNTFLGNVTGLGATLSNTIIIADGANNQRIYANSSGQIGINNTSPSANLHLPAGTVTAGTAPLKLTAGTNLTVAEDGAVEYDGTNYFASQGTVRYYIPKTLMVTATLDFPNTAAGSSATLTVTVTGAADGDIVKLGIPIASIDSGAGVYYAYVSGTDTVTVQYVNTRLSLSNNPASGVFRIAVEKYT